jgi:uncharacterized protein
VKPETSDRDDAVKIPHQQIREFCRRNHISKLAFFGSVLREDFSPHSDLDVLVEFEPGTRVGLRFFEMQDERSAIFGRNVDLNTPGFLGKSFRKQVLAENEGEYENQALPASNSTAGRSVMSGNRSG